MFVTNSGSTIKPFTTIKGIWTFTQNNAGIVATQPANLAQEGLRARLEFGADLTDVDNTGFGLALSGYYDGIGDNEYESWGGDLKLSNAF